MLNPDRDNCFTRLVEFKHRRIFVDKTDFIEKIADRIDSSERYISVSIPRRFEKSVISHMLSTYFSKGSDSRDIFDGLKISKSRNYGRNQNKHNVIYVDMLSVMAIYHTPVRIKGIHDFVDFLEYVIIEELKDNESYAELIKDNPEAGTKLLSVLNLICSKTKEKFIFFLNDCDLLYHDCRKDTKLHDHFWEFLRELFNSKESMNCFSLVYLTSILPIRKYGSKSALDSFSEYTMFNPEPYEEYFGFTDKEVDEIVKLPYCKLTINELRRMYEGYRLNNSIIYNPNSIVDAVDRNHCECYWMGTCSNEEVSILINKDFDGIKEDFLRLIEGQKIAFNLSTFQNDMDSINNRDDVFSLLVCLGYLGCINADDSDKNKKYAYVPNREINGVLMAIARYQPWYKSMKRIQRSESLFNAIMNLDTSTTSQLIGEIRKVAASECPEYSDEKLIEYVMACLRWSTRYDYSCKIESLDDNNDSHLVYKPIIISRSTPLIFVGFTFSGVAEDAFSQIKKHDELKNYKEEYWNVILVGINYDPKMKDHQCLIEKLD